MTLQTTAAACYTAKLALLKSKTALEPDTRAALTHRHKQKKTPRTIWADSDNIHTLRPLLRTQNRMKHKRFSVAGSAHIRFRRRRRKFFNFSKPKTACQKRTHTKLWRRTQRNGGRRLFAVAHKQWKYVNSMCRHAHTRTHTRLRPVCIWTRVRALNDTRFYWQSFISGRCAARLVFAARAHTREPRQVCEHALARYRSRPKGCAGLVGWLNE